MKVVLSFDDGRGDNYQLFRDYLRPKEIPFTINIASAYVNGTISEDNLPCKNTAMSVEELKDMATSPIVEIAGHGFEHLNELKDYILGLEWLNECVGVKCKGVASPYSAIEVKEARDLLSQLSDKYLAYPSYFRLGMRGKDTLITRIIRKIALFSGSKLLFRISMRHGLLSELDKDIFYSVPILRRASVKQILSLVSYAKKKNVDLILMFHSVLRDGEQYSNSTWSFSYRKFTMLCEYLLLDKDIQLCKMEELVLDRVRK